MDLDGTVIGNDLVISQPVKDAVRRAVESGLIVTLATGRMFQGTRRFAQELSIAQPVICYQGAMIRHTITGELWYHDPVPLEQAQEVIALAESQGKTVIGFVDDQCYVSRENDESQFYHRHSGVRPEPVGDLGAWLPEAPTKVLIITPKEQTDETVAFFRERFKDSLFVTRSYPLFTELTRLGVSKGKAMGQLCERLGLSRDEVIAIGDNLNDLDMIQFAGYGIAMGNGASPVQAAAAYVAPTQADDGVAEAIVGHILPRLKGSSTGPSPAAGAARA